MDEMVGPCSMHDNDEKCIRRTSERNRPLGKFRLVWEDNIKMDLLNMLYGCGLSSSVSRQGPVAGYCEYSFGLYKESGRIFRNNRVFFVKKTQ
jgi:hypothetical protein